MTDPIDETKRRGFDLETLLPHSKTSDFQDGDLLREKGLHYSDTLLLLRGTAKVDLEIPGGEARTIEISSGEPIGEISFLSGKPATGTVTASSDGTAILIDDATLDRIESASADVATELSRYMARCASERLERDSSHTFSDLPFADADRIEVKLCRTPELLRKAQELRYDIYCNELGRTSPYADEENKIIADSLDEFGCTFVALDGDNAIGSIRINCGGDGDLGLYTSLYNLKESRHYPGELFICTKFVIRGAFRGGPLAMKLMAAATNYGLRLGGHECYIDTIPSLIPFYKVMGFEVCAENFMHRENGISSPMCVNAVAKRKRLTREPSRERLASLYKKAQAIIDEEKRNRSSS